MSGVSHSRRFWPLVEVTVKKRTASPGTVTVVSSLAVLSPRSGSPAGALTDTEALFVMVPAPTAVTVIVTTALPLSGMVPRSHDTVRVAGV
jgi:hypothetical protein